jgi:hypothetical protein
MRVKESGLHAAGRCACDSGLAWSVSTREERPSGAQPVYLREDVGLHTEGSGGAEDIGSAPEHASMHPYLWLRCLSRPTPSDAKYYCPCTVCVTVPRPDSARGEQPAHDGARRALDCDEINEVNPPERSEPQPQRTEMIAFCRMLHHRH